jgi:hypothetical protein
MKTMPSKLQQIKSIINSAPDGKIFIASDFHTIENTPAIHVYINRLIEQKFLIKYSRGIYQKPKFNHKLNSFISPSLMETAETIARNNNWTIIPTGEIALSSLGLSTQISNKLVYVTTGPNKKYIINNRSIEFKHSFRINEIMTKHRKVAIAFQAFRTLGKNYINGINSIRFSNRFTESELSELKDLASKSTRWISEFSNKLIIHNNYETL